ncbi:hypothetical protein JY651_27910 [Pyxidicoccus parkwayensis]|uniref:MarR family transcriptional regulator n=1 Tax=Pyxidicoccus parkwayensis TaxID=2813578 RepID=A0ABX7NJY1_9BACT|nr:hypothetical protein [Pyxidicoccus parkwaysis]QSQ19170.1 hypothetical protein JY651_27910 [Pyxidicoccus parkwaysis]
MLSRLGRVAQHEPIPGEALLDGGDGAQHAPVIREMKGSGLAASEQDAADKRAVIVSLTPLGKERVRAALDLRGTEYFSRIDDWSNDDIARFTELLRRFNR